MNLATSPSHRFSEIHAALYAKLRNNSVNLQAVNSGMSVLSLEPEQALVFAYVRIHSEAQLVEKMIGLRSTEIDLQRHPLIELRLTERHLALELVLSPHAWWDQRNLIGKLSVRRHHDELRELLLALPQEMILGHWHGAALSDQHLTLRHLRSPRVMDAWLQTFSDGRDPIRIGIWQEASAINGPDAVADLFEAAQSLYGVYRFLAWTGRNDFQAFYNQRQESL
ncbi:MAG: hypothetical protein KA401_00565 [Anaerolineae bacterium]|nr:hypothetical protein [Chloroflexota bacterium]MBP6297809.1 hypothetical protein [Anaerolineae bacterium]